MAKVQWKRKVPLDIPEQKTVSRSVVVAMRMRDQEIIREEQSLKRQGVCPICNTYKTTLGRCAFGH